MAQVLSSMCRGTMGHNPRDGVNYTIKLHFSFNTILWLSYITYLAMGAAEGIKEEGEAEGCTWPICAVRVLWVRLQASVRHILCLCNAHGGLGARQKVLRRKEKPKVLMAGMRCTRAVS